MKRLLLAAALVLGLTLPAAAAAPQLVVDGLDFDFGQVYQGEQVNHVYTFRNVGDAPLHIDKVRSSCGCTAALVAEKTIAPGASGEIKATFDSTRFRGRVTKSIYLYTDDPNHHEARFVLQGEVLEKLTAAPAQLILENLEPGVERTASITITNQGPTPLELDGAKSTISDLKVALDTSSLEPGSSTQLQVRILPRAGATRFSGYIFVRGLGPQAPELRLPVQAVVR